MPWRELANDYSIVNALRKKAPDGYGLGETNGCPIDPSVEGGLNTAIKCGWYYFGGSGTIANAPSIPNGGYGSLLVTSRGAGNTITQMCFFETYTTIAIRYRFGSEWQPWEYINPPMALGVEYRTTERYLGKPVYVKLIDCGNLPDGTTKEVAHGITNLDFIVGAQAIASNSSSGFNGHTYLPAIYNGSLTDRWTDYLAGIDTKNIRIFCGGGLAGCLVYVTFKYTKTTD